MYFSIKKIFRTTLVFLVIAAWLFSGWPQIWHTPPIPPEVKEAKAADAWLNSGYKYRKKLTLDNTLVSGSTDFTNFPVLIAYTDTDLAQDSDCSAGSPAINGPCNASGFDIIFSDSHATSPTKLDHEIETYTSSSGLIVMFVEVPTLGATTDTNIYIYYGNSSISTTQEAITGVWDSNYVGVWHLDEGDSTASGFYKDSTSNANNGTLTDADGDSVQATGKVGNGMDLNGDADYIDVGSATSLDDLGTLTVTAWVNKADANDGYVVAKRDANNCAGETSFLLNINEAPTFYKKGTTNLFRTANNASMTAAQLEHVAMTWDGSTTAANATHYVNGAGVGGYQTTQNGVSLGSDASCSYFIGAKTSGTAAYLDGIVDEVRVSNTQRSADYIKTEYDNAANQSTGSGKFIKTLGSEEEYSSPVDVTAAVDDSWLKGSGSSDTLVITVNSVATSTASIAWVKITRPSSSFTLSAGSATGWTAATTASTVTFTGSTIAAGASATFTITLDTAASDVAQAAWTVDVDDDSDASSTVTGHTSSAGSLNTGIDATAPTSVSVSSSTANSSSQITATAATASDASSGLHASPYWFDETSGKSGGTDSTDWQSSTSFVDTGLSGNTEYCYRVKARDAVANESSFSSAVCATTQSSAQGLTPAGLAAIRDSIPPTLSLVTASTTATTATIKWKTNEQANSLIKYGTTTAYGLQSEKILILKTDHEATLTGLRPETFYHYQILAEDELSNLTKSQDYTFVTLTLEGEAPTIFVSPTTGETIIVTPEEQRKATKETKRKAEEEAATKEKESAKGEPPVISGVTIVAARPTSARIAWDTDVPATSQIVFGTTSGELNQATIEFATLVAQHAVTISDLEPETSYVFAVVSRSEKGAEARSQEYPLTTPSLEIQTVIDISKPQALPAGSPGTQTPHIAAGETVTAVPILPSARDKTSPTVTLFRFRENPTEDTSPLIRGSAIDREGVIAAISYSTDGGASWHPIDTVIGIGSSSAQFSATIPNLRDGNYPIIFRVRDNSSNVGKSEIATLVVDIQPPATGANMLLQGTQPLAPSERGTLFTIAGITQRFVTSAVGGAISVDVVAKGKEGKEVVFPLIYSKPADLWFGDLTFPEADSYDLAVKAVDGAGRISQRVANPVVAEKTGLVKDNDTNEPLTHAKISVFSHSSVQGDFVLWPGEIYNQANPFVTGKNGAFMFVLPPGMYYLTVEKEGYKTFYTSIQTLTQHQTMVFTVPLIKKLALSLTLPFGKRLTLSLPGLPDFRSAARLESVPSLTPRLSHAFGAFIGTQAPLFNLPDSKGENVDIRYLRGKNTIFSTWSTWSPLAQAQIPVLDRLQKEHGDDFHILLFSFQESPGIIETYLRRGGYALTSVIDQKAELMKSYPILTVPQHFFIDKKGVVRDILVGFFDEDALLKKIEEL